MAAITPSSNSTLSHNTLGEQSGRLRVAIFADYARQPRWLVKAMARLVDSDFAEIIGVTVIPCQKIRRPVIWQAGRRLDRLVFGRGSDPSSVISLDRLAPAAPHYSQSRPMLPNSASSANNAWRHTLGSTSTDVIFLLGNIDDTIFDGAARFGVWRYCFGEQGCIDEAMAGWRETVSEQATTQAGLRVRLWPGSSRLLYQSRSCTYPYSPERNRANILAKASHFAERALRALYNNGEAMLRTPALALTCRTVEPPGNIETLYGLAKTASRIAKRTKEKLCRFDQWSIAFRFGISEWNGSLQGFRSLQPPKDRIWADPFPICYNDRYYIFFKDAPIHGVGHIAVTEVRGDGSHSPPIRVLERDYHLSYPFLIKSEGALFMIPETIGNNCIELYRCYHFPDKWRLECILLQGVNAVDATVIERDGRWWMFVTIAAEGSEPYDELHIYHAPTLHGPWLPHQNNPVKSDVCSARPAGSLFYRDGALYRPAQICAPRYGAGLMLCRIEELSPHRYRERVMQCFLPPPASGLLGMHTLNQAGQLLVIDCFVRQPRWSCKENKIGAGATT